MIVNQKIKQYLEDHGITQAFLEKKTGISYDKLSKILSCKRKISVTELKIISDALNVEVNIFLN